MVGRDGWLRCLSVAMRSECYCCATFKFECRQVEEGATQQREFIPAKGLFRKQRGWFKRSDGKV